MRGLRELDCSLSSEAKYIKEFAEVAAWKPGSEYVIGTEHLLPGFAHSDEALEVLAKFGITGEALMDEALKHEPSTERVLPGGNQTQKYSEVLVLSSILAYQESPNGYEITPKHIIEAVRRTESCSAHLILSRLSANPNF